MPESIRARISPHMCRRRAVSRRAGDGTEVSGRETVVDDMGRDDPRDMGVHNIVASGERGGHLLTDRICLLPVPLLGNSECWRKVADGGCLYWMDISMGSRYLVVAGALLFASRQELRHSSYRASASPRNAQTRINHRRAMTRGASHCKKGTRRGHATGVSERHFAVGGAGETKRAQTNWAIEQKSEKCRKCTEREATYQYRRLVGLTQQRATACRPAYGVRSSAAELDASLSYLLLQQFAISPPIRYLRVTWEKDLTVTATRYPSSFHCKWHGSDEKERRHCNVQSYPLQFAEGIHTYGLLSKA